MIHSEQQNIQESIQQIASYIMIAAQTAPKGRGMDCLSIKTINEKEKNDLISVMKKIGTEHEGAGFFLRDAENVQQSDVVVLIGCQSEIRGLNCGLCGYKHCTEKPVNQPCAFNITDLGIALGSAVSTAMQFKVDNRILYSAGKAAMELNLLGREVSCIFAIPLSVSKKNIYFDRK